MLFHSKILHLKLLNEINLIFSSKARSNFMKILDNIIGKDQLAFLTYETYWIELTVLTLSIIVSLLQNVIYQIFDLFLSLIG